MALTTHHCLASIPIDRRDDRLGIAEKRLKDGAQGRQEGSEIGGTAPQDAQEIDPTPGPQAYLHCCKDW